MLGCGILFVVCGVTSHSRVAILHRFGWCWVVWQRVVVALRRVAACAVVFRCLALGGVLWCRALAVPCRMLCCFVLLVVLCSIALCCVVSCSVVLSCCVLVRWVGRWCVASGIVLQCCASFLVGLSRCRACCVAHRCLVVGCGLVFLVVGFVVVCYVPALRGVGVSVLLVVPHCCAM